MTEEKTKQILEDNKGSHKEIFCANITSKKSVWEIIKYIFKSRAWPVFVSVACLIIASVFLMISDNYSTDEIKGDYFKKDKLLSTLLQIATFIGISGLWLSSIYKEWKESMNKYLSASFTYKDSKKSDKDVIRIRCRYAKLINVADARGMAQSFAKTLNCGAYLDLAPSLEDISKEIEVDGSNLINSGKPFLHYDVTIRLTKNIKKLCDKKKSKPSEEKVGSNQDAELNQIKISEDEYLLWDYPFDVATKANLRKIKNENP